MTVITTLRHAMIASAALLALGTVQAANLSKAVYHGAKDDIKSTYKVEREACNNLAANAKDICVETAKGREKVALAQLEFDYSGKSKDRAEVYEARYKARYNVAIEKCDDLGGQAKDVCVQEAKTNRDKAKSELKLAKKISSAADTAVDEQMKADYKLAKEKCDTLSGDGKDVCMASAKARFTTND